MDDEIEYVDSADVAWYKYTCSYTDHDGNQFCFDIWAKSDQDAAWRMDAIKQTAVIDGRICTVIEAGSGDVLADSTVPENETGITH